MITNNKKEISCKAVLSLFHTVKKKNIDLNKILEGVPYELSYLLNKQERIEWWVLCKIFSNSKPYFSRSEYEQMGKDFVQNESYIEGFVLSLMLYSSGRLNNILKKQLLKATSSIVKPIFPCLTQQTNFIEKNKIQIHFCLNPGYQHCPELFYSSIGVLEKLGSQTSKKGFKVDFSLTANGGIYDLSWEEAGFIFNLKKWVRWLFNMRKAFLDLTESHDELLNQYNKLEDSKKLLQKQTTQLKTAHEITKSIRQSLDLNKTLKAITDALVNEANFASAHIKLFKDTEGNNLDIEVFSGIDDANIDLIIKPILINESKTGVLIIYPKVETEIAECEELINYLVPIINISIHDSLILRTVTDYKNNLEKKVEKRTAELKITQDELSKTVNLLQVEQQVQNRFFTNISHEFRTPLTLILGPVKQITEKLKDEKIKNKLGVVYKNANRLLSLVNQLLDISKLESHSMKLQTSPQDIIPLIRDLALSFAAYSERKKITVKINSTQNKIIVYLDKEKIEKIITNLLSNAFKFTPDGGTINVTLKLTPYFNFMTKKNENDISSESSNKKSLQNSGLHLQPAGIEMTTTHFNQIKDRTFLEISIQDTGIGIPKEKLNKIFDRFYQVDSSHTREQEGTGLGLSLTKELVELHKGRIEVESEEGKGTKVVIKIPLGKDHLKSDEICEPVKDEIGVSYAPSESIYYEETKTNKLDIESITETEKPLLLLIEDNSDVRDYIRDNLKTDYRVVEAIDGEDGWNKAIINLPELIVSDVMMPKMDGFRLCERLKTDQRTSHIPVILLTAKATMNDKVSGLETGADDYIVKPFEPDELRARIKNLIEQRKRIHEHFQKKGLFELNQTEITSIDKKFLQKTFDIINKNISNPSFGVESLADNLAVSRYVLYKKIISLTGESPVELIRRIRLFRAAELIEKKFGNLSEIALEVGFNNPAYFSDCFKKQFRVPPSQYPQKVNSN